MSTFSPYVTLSGRVPANLNFKNALHGFSTTFHMDVTEIKKLYCMKFLTNHKRWENGQRMYELLLLDEKDPSQWTPKQNLS